MTPLEAKRNAFMINVIHRTINAALIDFKQRKCHESGNVTNYEKNYIVGGRRKM